VSGASGPPDGAPATDARSVAMTVLLRVERGAYAGPVLDRALAALGRRDDRALCTELVYGSLRWRGELDHVLAGYLRLPLARLPDAAKIALRLGAYQVLHLRRVPAHAAVSESVRLVRAAGLGALTGVVNGVLRRIVRDGVPPFPADPVAAAAARTSHPAWLVAAWRAQYGEARARALLDYDNEPPAVAVRVRPEVGRDRLLGRWQEAGVAAEPTALSPHGLRLAGGQAVSALPGYDEAAFVVQDEAAMLAVEWLADGPGGRVVDACAGRGAKTLGLLDAVGPDGSVLAVDLHAAKLQALAREATRRGHRVHGPDGTPASGPGLQWVAADARRLPDLVGPDGAARILLDAPCTGLGVLRRRPELRWRRSAGDAQALSALQGELLDAALASLAVGGEVLYVTCSTDPLEDEGVVASALARHPRMAPAPVAPALPDAPGVDRGADGSVRLFGPETGTDSFFFARLRRTR